MSEIDDFNNKYMNHLIYRNFDVTSKYVPYDFKSVYRIFSDVNKFKGLNSEEKLEVYTKLFDLVDSEITDIPKKQLDEFYNSVPEIRVACYFLKVHYYFECLSDKDTKDALSYLRRLTNEGKELLNGNLNKVIKSDIAKELKMIFDCSMVDLSSDSHLSNIDVHYLDSFILSDNISLKFKEKFYSCTQKKQCRNNHMKYDNSDSNFKFKVSTSSFFTNYHELPVVKILAIVFINFVALLLIFLF